MHSAKHCLSARFKVTAPVPSGPIRFVSRCDKQAGDAAATQCNFCNEKARQALQQLYSSLQAQAKQLFCWRCCRRCCLTGHATLKAEHCLLTTAPAVKLFLLLEFDVSHCASAGLLSLIPAMRHAQVMSSVINQYGSCFEGRHQDASATHVHTLNMASRDVT